MMIKPLLRRYLAALLCLSLVWAALPAAQIRASSAMTVNVKLNKEEILENQSITASVSITGGSAPYKLYYMWIIYGFDADFDSRPVFYQEGTLSDNGSGVSFTTALTAPGYGQLEIDVTDAQGRTALGFSEAVVFDPSDFPAKFASQLLQGRWVDVGETDYADFSAIFGPGGRVQMTCKQAAWLGGHKLITGKASISDKAISVTTDLGDTLHFSYTLDSDSRYLYMTLNTPGGGSAWVEYDPNYVYSPFPNMTGVKPTPPPLTAFHQSILGQWKGVGSYSPSEQFSLLLTVDGRIRFEYTNPDRPTWSTIVTGTAKAEPTVISYDTDAGNSYYLQCELSADGQSLWIMYQDHESILRRGSAPSLPGDADNNSKVEIADLAAIVDMIVSNSFPKLPHNADADGNGSINISDLQWVINKIIGG